MKRTSRIAAMIMCITLFAAVSAAQEMDGYGANESSEYSLNFEAVEASNMSEQFDYSLNKSTVEMNGTVQMPTPCHELETDLSQAEDRYELDIISVDGQSDDFESNETEGDETSGTDMNDTERTDMNGTEVNETGTEACAQVIDYQGFEASFTASAPYNLSVSFNGESVGNITVEPEENESVVNESSVGDESLVDNESEMNETESNESVTDETAGNESAVNESSGETESPELGNETPIMPGNQTLNESDEASNISDGFNQSGVNESDEQASEGESSETDGSEDEVNVTVGPTSTSDNDQAPENQNSEGLLSGLIGFIGSIFSS